MNVSIVCYIYHLKPFKYNYIFLNMQMHKKNEERNIHYKK